MKERQHSKKQFLRCAHKRNDAWGREVAFRANSAVSDLYAEITETA